MLLLRTRLVAFITQRIRGSNLYYDVNNVHTPLPPTRGHHVTHLHHCSERPSLTIKSNLVIFRYGPENNVENNHAFKILSR